MGTFPFLGSDQYMETQGMNVSEANDCNYPYKLQWSNSCALTDPLGVASLAELYLDIEFFRVDYEQQKEAVDNGYGGLKVMWSRKEPIFSFDLYVNDKYRHEIYFAQDHDTIELVPLHSGGAALKVTSMDIVDGQDSDEDLYIMKISLKFEDSAMAFDACDCGAYDNAPYEDDCGDTGGGGDPPVDPCEGFDIEIVKTGDTLYTNLVSPPVNGTTTYRWYFIGSNGVPRLLSSTAENVSLGEYGTYRVVAAKAGCEVSEDFLYQDPCTLVLDVVAEGPAGAVALIEGGSGSETIVWTFIDDQGTETTLAGNDTTIIAQETGYYKATVTDGGCERSDMVYIVVDENEVNGCNITGSIADDGSTLTLTYSGCTQPPSIQWTLDAGDGSGPQAYGTGPSVSSDNSGHYTALLTCGNCTKEFHFTKITPCDSNACGTTISLQRSGENINATVTGCSGTYDVKWYLNTGGGYGSAIGMGDSFAITGNGMYKAIATCDDGCTAEAEMLVYDCDACAVTSSIDVSGATLTASATGCPGGSTEAYQWFFDDGSGYIELPNITAAITASTPGLYKVVITCGDCTAEAATVYTGCDTCTEVTTGTGGTYNVC